MLKSNVFNLRFLSLCSLTFLALCNVSLFYNFNVYLMGIGFAAKGAGFIIGLYSLTAMFLYATVSQRIHLGNAYRLMLVGIMMFAGCGIAYMFATEFWSMAILRMINGAGVFLIMAPCTVVLVTIIPAEKSGFAFSIYSVALLAPYSIMPAVSEMMQPWIDSPTILYMVAGGLMLPAALLIFFIQPDRKTRNRNAETKETISPCLDAKGKNLLRKPVLSILLINSVYFTLFSAMFYLFEGFAVNRGLSSPGYFFTVQMGVMVAIRLVGGGIFDTFSKVVLVSLSLLITGAGFVLLYVMPTPAWAFYIAVVFGIGMGFCIPPLNSLMYLVTKPEYRGYNANMMMLTVHLGTFSGPCVGSLIIGAGGYELFLMVAALMTVCGSGFFLAANPAKEIGLDLKGKQVDTATGHCR